MVARHKKTVVMMCCPESDDWRHIKRCPLPSLGCRVPTRFLGKMVLVVPLLAALAAHLAEPGLLTTDKAKKNQ